MKCPNCDAEIKEGSKFCRRCGTRVDNTTPKSICPNCGARCDADDSFCGECGAALLSEAEADGAMAGFVYDVNADGTYIIRGIKGDCPMQLVVPEGVVEIADFAFEEQSILGVSLPEGLRVIGVGAFKHCRRLTEIHLPDSLVQIGNEAFAYCARLHELSIPAGVRRIPYCMCYGCTSLATLNLHDDIDEMDTYGFCGCTALAQVRLPVGLKRIADSLFDGCDALAEVVLPAHCTCIDNYAFRSTAIRRITMPVDVIQIGYRAFGFIPELRVDYEGTCAKWDKINLDRHWLDGFSSADVYCKDGRRKCNG